MNRIRTGFLITLAALASVGAAQKNTVHPSALSFKPLDWKVPSGAPYRTVLPNGLRAYIATDSTFPVVSIIGYVRCGSLGDPAGKEGLGGLMAQLLRSGGTKKIGADSLDALLDQLAMNVSFSLSQAQLQFTFSFLAEYTDTALSIIRQMLFEPAFEPARFQKERDLALQRIMHRFDNPGPILEAADAKAVYPGQANSRLATEKSVSSLTRDDIVAQHGRAFRTGKIILAASGRFNAASLAERLTAIFPKAEADTARSGFPPVVFSKAPRSLIVDKKITQSYVRISMPLFERPNPEYYAVSVLDYILGGGSFSSRLNEKVRSDKGLAYHIASKAESNYTYPGTFSITFYTKVESTVEAIRICRDEIERIRKTGVTDEEVTNAEQSLVDAVPSMFRNKDNLMDRCAYNEYYGRSMNYFDAFADSIHAVKKADVLAMARKYLDWSAASFAIVSDTAELWKVDTAQAFRLRKLPSLTVTTPENLPALP